MKLPWDVRKFTFRYLHRLNSNQLERKKKSKDSPVFEKLKIIL